ncbi:Uncharacterised protein [Moraxella lacunata]|uniref:Uncharacterized protein n=1 Tax=Moraxella lacunata TaxID=477 RepID=A0A378TRT0_MORLA|nr:hypothetical protein [Moraxella lacunata]STZ63486.1 Uncharacterised protein [Moraxella lacunata]
MKNGIIVDTDYFEGVDLNRPSIKHPIFEKMQANAKLAKQQETAWLDEDLSIWITNQDSTTKRHINEIIRHAMALKLASV